MVRFKMVLFMAGLHIIGINLLGVHNRHRRPLENSHLLFFNRVHNSEHIFPAPYRKIICCCSVQKNKFLIKSQRSRN